MRTPKQLLTDLIGGVTTGIEPASLDAITETTDWKLLLTSAKQYAVQDALSPTTLTRIVGRKVTAFGLATLRRWRLSLRETGASDNLGS